MVTAHEYLKGILSKYKLDEGEVERLMNIRREVEKSLMYRYGSHIEKILYSGSYAKKTAISLKYDLDLCVMFKRSAFRTLDSMYLDVGDFLKRSFARYRPVGQRVSWGMTLADGRGLDIVPARSFEDGTDDANLYVSNDDTSIKTNIKKHIEYISESSVRPIIKLMKVWKFRNKVDIKSFTLELATIEALRTNKGNDYADMVRTTLRFLANEFDTTRLVDPANSNNVVSNSMSDWEKQKVKVAAAASLNGGWEQAIW
ncbi:MAG: hypothetical protein GX224_00385 [Thermoplasmatales archaeon]|nr:hypothetical protein [Thermoplasmatales archaeon]